jgi:hypothetical protein
MRQENIPENSTRRFRKNEFGRKEMNDPAVRSGVSSSLLGRHSVLDTACPVLDTGESSRAFWIPSSAGMTNSRQAAGSGPQGIQVNGRA